MLPLLVILTTCHALPDPHALWPWEVLPCPSPAPTLACSLIFFCPAVMGQSILPTAHHLPTAALLAFYFPALLLQHSFLPNSTGHEACPFCTCPSPLCHFYQGDVLLMPSRVSCWVGVCLFHLPLCLIYFPITSTCCVLAYYAWRVPTLL